MDTSISYSASVFITVTNLNIKITSPVGYGTVVNN